MADRELGFKKYEYLSRYANVPVFIDLRGERYHGSVMWTKDGLPYTLYEIKHGDTLSKIANDLYGNPTLNWVIMEVNRIINPFKELVVGETIKIVALNALDWGKRF